MATYSTFGGIPIFKAPYIPIVKVKDMDIHVNPESVYVPSGGQPNDPAERLTLLNKLQAWLWVYPYTWSKLKAASSEIVSNTDLVFILDLCQNLKSYYPDDSRFYGKKTKDQAFLLETISYIILGEEPEKAKSLALMSMQTEKFVCGESWLVTITNMPAQVKAQFKLTEGATGAGYDEGDDGTLSETGTATETKKAFNWLLVGGIIFLIVRKK